MLLILSVSFSTFAGFPPTDDCSNLGATIQVDMTLGTVTVLTKLRPTTYVTLGWDDVNVEETVLVRKDVTEYGNTSNQNRFSSIVISKKDGSSMPNAYNNLAKDGKLVDDYVCSERSAWINE